jgi:hypothetical protein
MLLLGGVKARKSCMNTKTGSSVAARFGVWLEHMQCASIVAKNAIK